MSLVNSKTPKAHPDEQFQGTYNLKPVSVFMYEEGSPMETFNAVEVGELLRYYGVDSVGSLPPVAPKEPAPADVYGFGDVHRLTSGAPGIQNLPKDEPQQSVSAHNIALAYPYGEVRKVVKKRETTQTGVVAFDATLLLLKGLSTEQADYVFQILANQLGYDIQ